MKLSLWLAVDYEGSGRGSRANASWAPKLWTQEAGAPACIEAGRAFSRPRCVEGLRLDHVVWRRPPACPATPRSAATLSSVSPVRKQGSFVFVFGGRHILWALPGQQFNPAFFLCSPQGVCRRPGFDKTTWRLWSWESLLSA